MHGIRHILLERRAESLCLPLEQILLSKEVPNEEYKSRMQATLAKFQKDGAVDKHPSRSFLNVYFRFLSKDFDIAIKFTESILAFGGLN